MNKTAIKNFAIWARNKLISDITYKAGLLGISEKGIKGPLPQSTKDVQFFDIGTKNPYSITGFEIDQRRKLTEEIEKKVKQSDFQTAFKSVVEEVAYTWFNRLIAVRFMEVNEYLPSKIRALSSESDIKTEPDLVTAPFDSDLEFTQNEKDLIVQLKNDNKLDELFRLLFIKQCNALNAILPNLFEKTSDYTELLLNVSFTDQEGVVYRLVHDIDEDDFNVAKEGQVEIIGWLYQYYNTEPKDETFALLKKNVKITKERIPAATQLFTPDWIVRYMVENSLGRLWIEHIQASSAIDHFFGNLDFSNLSFDIKSNEMRIGELKEKWKYYLDEAEQELDVKEQLKQIRAEYKDMKPQDIKVIDPCMGSGHILVYAFDVLLQIYEDSGYSQKDAAELILRNNLNGLDIDNRAYQLAYFAVMMKARQYNRRILNGETDCHVYSIQESNEINRSQLKYFGWSLIDIERNTALNQIEYILDTFVDAKEYGSILNVDVCDWEILYRFVGSVDYSGQMSLDAVGLEETKDKLWRLIEIAAVMAQKYDVVVTNPPYMGSNNMGQKLSEFVKEKYPHSKADLSTVCMEMCLTRCSNDGIYAMINIPVWMTQSSFNALRGDLLQKSTIINMLHFGRGIFGSDFGTTAFTIRNTKLKRYQATYRRLFDEPTKVDTINVKEKWFFEGKGFFTIKQSLFEKISGCPIAYWVTAGQVKAFRAPALNTYAEPRQGFATGNNDMFLRFWHEVRINRIGFGNEDSEMAHKSGHKWFPCNKGGAYRRWYGNNDRVVNWENDGAEMKAFSGSVIRNPSYYFREGMTWSTATMSKLSMRYSPTGFLFESKGSVCFSKDEKNLKYLLAFLNTKIVEKLLLVLAPTVDYHEGPLGRIPVKISEPHRERILLLSNECINIAKADWDAFETSWDFKRHPLAISFQEKENQLLHSIHTAAKGDAIFRLNDRYGFWVNECKCRFNQIKLNEEELNHIFIDIYDLQDELTRKVDVKDITIRKADLERDIRSFISYAVGCMFGRYSLDVEGLVFAGGDWDQNKYKTYIPDNDNVLPITDEEYFKDDIVGRFTDFVKTVYGQKTIEENLDFIAKALGNKGNTSREVIRNYFLNDFFKDHCKVYQNRPIYWIFDSGKSNGFKAIVYMHRYDENTIGNLRIDYLHRMQRVYESEIVRMQETIANSTDAREVAVAEKRKDKLTKQIKETKDYDEKIAHLALARIAIDLDDGVKVNYEKVQTGTDGKKLEVLTKI